MNKRVSFEAVVLKNPDMDAGYIVFPYDVEALYGVRGQLKVKAVFDDKVLYRGSLAKMGGKVHLLGMNKTIRQELAKNYGDTVKVNLEPDTDIRQVEIPEAIKAGLAAHPEALAYFEGLSFTDRKAYISWLTTAKKEETRASRLKLFMEKLQAKKKLQDK